MQEKPAPACDRAHGVFFGWWVVAASVVGLSVGPGQFAFGSLGLFIVPLGAEFGWDRAEISLALTVFTVALAVSLPVVGTVVDRAGSRRVLIPSLLTMGILLGSIPLVLGQLWHLLLIFALIGALAAGANSLPYMLTISAWFDRRRGLAIGIAMAGSGLGYAYVPPLLQHLIEKYSWQSGFYALAAIAIGIALPIILWLFRETPQEMGLEPDGESLANRRASASVQYGLQRSEAMRTRHFWLLFVMFSGLSFSLYGLLPHIVPMLTDRGMTGTAAALAASSVGVTIMIARVVIGYLIDRFFAPAVAAIFFTLSAAGLGILATGTAGFPVFGAMILIGFTIGAEIDLMAFLAGRYFGLRHFGAIYGLLFASLLIGTSLGPFVYGLAFESTGSYVSILIVCCVVNGFASLITLVLPEYPDLALESEHA